jgi:type III secretory pathway component EscV
MDTSKSWWASQTIWASLLQMAVGVATATGLINDAAGQIVLADGPAVVIGAVTTGLAIWSLVGRVQATKTISSPPAK